MITYILGFIYKYGSVTSINLDYKKTIYKFSLKNFLSRINKGYEYNK